MKKFTTQEVIKMGAELFDRDGFDRKQIWRWLAFLLDKNYAEFDLERVYDLIVG
jgi:hypothetical protein